MRMLLERGILPSLGHDRNCTESEILGALAVAKEFGVRLHVTREIACFSSACLGLGWRSLSFASLSVVATAMSGENDVRQLQPNDAAVHMFAYKYTPTCSPSNIY